MRRKMLKKTMAVLLAATMAVSIVPETGFEAKAATEFTTE